MSVMSSPLDCSSRVSLLPRKGIYISIRPCLLTVNRKRASTSAAASGMMLAHEVAGLLARVVGEMVLGGSVPMEMATLVAVMVSTVPLHCAAR